jgi:hypothetical protein
MAAGMFPSLAAGFNAPRGFIHAASIARTAWTKDLEHEKTALVGIHTLGRNATTLPPRAEQTGYRPSPSPHAVGCA